MPTATIPVDERVSLTFAAQGNGSTKWIEIQFPTENPPTSMLEALAEIGFAPNPHHMRLPAYTVFAHNAAGEYVPLGYRAQEEMLVKSGGGLFGGWTAEEERTNMRIARAVLRRFGFTRVPVWKKTPADMM